MFLYMIRRMVLKIQFFRCFGHSSAKGRLPAIEAELSQISFAESFRLSVAE